MRPRIAGLASDFMDDPVSPEVIDDRVPGQDWMKRAIASPASRGALAIS